MKMNSRFLFGIIVVVLGILLLFEQVGVFPILSNYIWVLFSMFWPLILIFFGAKLLINRNNIPGFILLLLGVAFLSSNLFTWDFFSVLWPVIIIAIGISLLFPIGEEIKGKKSFSEKDFLSENVLFWGAEKKVNSKDFKGGEFNVAFGELELDLRNAKISKGGAKIHINCAFGGIEIYVPKECRVKTNGTGIFGGWDTKIEERKISEPVLEITGGVVFGGVEINE